MKNVLQIANYAAPYRGNFIESLERLSFELECQGIKNIYVLPRQNENQAAFNWIEEIRNTGREVYSFEAGMLSDYKLIRRLIKQENIGIIHGHFLTTKQYIVIYMATLFTKTKLVVHFHNHSVKATGVKKILRRFLYRKSTLFACSESVYRALGRDYPNNERHVVENGIFFDRISGGKTALREEYGIKENTLLCLIFGFDFYRKGVDIALKALSELNSEQVKYELLISLTKNFETAEEEIIKILGEIPEWLHIIKARPDIEALYNMCDIFLSPSREEGFCYSAIEAAYCGCKTIVSKIPAQGDLKIPGAYWFEAENIASLKNKIEEAGSRDNLRNDEVISELKDNYDVKQWVSKIIELYNEMGLQK